MQINPKQLAELGFWERLCQQETPEEFKHRRFTDCFENLSHYQGKEDLMGEGLEVGTGCYSQLEAVANESNHIVSIDPLNDEFDKFLKVRNSKVQTLTMDGEELLFEPGQFDWVVCWNVIDHTPNPSKMVNEIFRVLKPGGKLYFEVHFDDALAPPHYDLWREETVDKYFKDRKVIFKNIIRNDAGNQSKCYMIFEK